MKIVYSQKKIAIMQLLRLLASAIIIAAAAVQVPATAAAPPQMPCFRNQQPAAKDSCVKQLR